MRIFLRKALCFGSTCNHANRNPLSSSSLLLLDLWIKRKPNPWLYVCVCGPFGQQHMCSRTWILIKILMSLHPAFTVPAFRHANLLVFKLISSFKCHRWDLFKTWSCVVDVRKQYSMQVQYYTSSKQNSSKEWIALRQTFFSFWKTKQTILFFWMLHIMYKILINVLHDLKFQKYWGIV